jgi:hypothetical protein
MIAKRLVGLSSEASARVFHCLGSAGDCVVPSIGGLSSRTLFNFSGLTGGVEKQYKERRLVGCVMA